MTDACCWIVLDPLCPKNLHHHIYFVIITNNYHCHRHQHHHDTVIMSVTVKWFAVKTASKMTYTVSGGALNSPQSSDHGTATVTVHQVLTINAAQHPAATDLWTKTPTMGHKSTYPCKWLGPNTDNCLTPLLPLIRLSQDWTHVAATVLPHFAQSHFTQSQFAQSHFAQCHLLTLTPPLTLTPSPNLLTLAYSANWDWAKWDWAKWEDTAATYVLSCSIAGRKFNFLFVKLNFSGP